MLIEIHAKEKAAVGDNWTAYRFECFPKALGRTLYYQVTGAVFDKVTRGKRKGRPNWDKEHPGTEREVILPVDEHEQWVKQWELKTGKCSECEGEGKTVASCSVKDGTTYRQCSKCKGSGKSRTYTDAVATSGCKVTLPTAKL